MRPVSALLALAVATAALPALDSPLTARYTITSADLGQIVERPDSYAGILVRFHATWVGPGRIYDRFRSQFVPERHVNIVVWDDRADLSKAEVRAQAVPTLYIDRNLPLVSSIGVFSKYELVEITGRVESIQGGQPWITISEIRPLADAGAWTDAAVYHVEQANRLSVADPPAWDLVDEHYAHALAVNLPLPAAISVRGERARALLAASRYAEAATVLAEALELSKRDPLLTGPERAALHAQRAKALSETRQYAEAVQHVEQALALDPSIGEAYAIYGIALAGLERYEEARRQCDKAVRLRPQDAEVRWYLGRILDLQGKHDEAIEALKKAIDLTPKDYRLHKAIAAVYYHRSRAGGPNAAADVFTSLREYDITVRLNAGDGDTYLQWAAVLDAAALAGYEAPGASGREKATRDMATARLVAGVAAAPKHVPLHEALAARYAEDKRPDEAIVHLRALVGLEPSSFARTEALAAALRTQEKPAEALAAYRAHLDRNPGSGEAAVALAEAHAAAGDAAQGIAVLERFLAQHRDDRADKLLGSLRAQQKAAAAPAKP